MAYWLFFQLASIWNTVYLPNISRIPGWVLVEGSPLHTMEVKKKDCQGRSMWLGSPFNHTIPYLSVHVNLDTVKQKSTDCGKSHFWATAQERWSEAPYSVVAVTWSPYWDASGHYSGWPPVASPPFSPACFPCLIVSFPTSPLSWHLPSNKRDFCLSQPWWCFSFASKMSSCPMCLCSFNSQIFI